MVNALEILENGFDNTISGIGNVGRAVSVGQVAAVTTAVVIGAGGTALVVSKVRKRKARTKKGRSRDRKFGSKQKHEVAYRKRRAKKGKKSTQKFYKSKSSVRKKKVSKHKKRAGLYKTKNGQPYRIMANGKARFVKKSKGRKK